MSLIECRDLTRTYHRGSEAITPLDGLDLDIEAGGFVALMGPSGSGKTTLLNLLAGIDRPTRGSLMVDGKAIHDLSNSALSTWRSRAVGYIFQLYNLVPVLTAYENIELPLLLHNLSRKKRHAKVSAALDLVGIGGPPRPLPAPTLGRAGAARGDCAGDRHRSNPDPCRRTNGRP